MAKAEAPHHDLTAPRPPAVGLGAGLRGRLRALAGSRYVETFRWLQRDYLRPQYKLLALSFALAWLASGATAGLVWLVKPALTAVLSGDNPALVLGLALAVVVIGPLGGLATYFHSKIAETVGQRVLTGLQRDLFRSFLRNDLKNTAHTHTGVMISLTTSEAGRAMIGVTTLLFTLTQDAILFLCLAVVMVVADWQLALVALLALPAIGYGLVRMGGAIRSLTDQQIRVGQKISSRVTDVLGALRFVKASNAEDYELDRHRQLTKHRQQLAVALARTKSATAPLVDTASAVAIATAIVFAAVRASSGAPEATASLAAFLISVLIAYRPVKRLSKSITNFQVGMVAAQRIRNALARQPSIVDRPGARVLTGVGTVRVDNVRFAYRRGHEVLKGVSPDLSPGRTVALVGPSGSGKSTLLNLIPRLYEVDDGAIHIDGTDVRDVTLSSLRASVALVSQDAAVLDDTVRANVAYGLDEGHDDERVWAALEAARAATFVRKMAEGLDSRLGEGGKRVSGGQRQRLCLARALYRDAPILLLDEPTASLDARLEQDVRKSLTAAAASRAVLVVSHRLPVIEFADEIHVLLDGEIVESGTHRDMIVGDGLYARLFKIQELELKLGRRLTE